LTMGETGNKREKVEQMTGAPEGLGDGGGKGGIEKKTVFPSKKRRTGTSGRDYEQEQTIKRSS